MANLFDLFSNDTEFGTRSSISLFADKIHLAQEVASFQEDLDKIEGWAAVWQMRFNIWVSKICMQNTHYTHKIFLLMRQGNHNGQNWEQLFLYQHILETGDITEIEIDYNKVTLTT